MHFLTFSELAPVTVQMPPSSTEILHSKFSCIARMFLPPGPMIRPIFSLGICTDSRRGALGLSSARGALSALFISRSTWRRPCLACSSACDMICRVRPSHLMSICSAVMPRAVPTTLKSMSPQASSLPRMSVRMAKRLPSITRPIAMPATGCLIGTPASIIASVPEHAVAIDELPFDSRISLVTRIV